MLVAAALAFGSGCAKEEDWIQRTQVTVDVTGTWSGSCGVAGGGSVPLIEMTLEQGGPKVKGSARIQAYGGTVQIEGTLKSDVLRYNSQPTKVMAGEFQVKGDEMSGWAVKSSWHLICHLRRQPASENQGREG